MDDSFRLFVEECDTFQVSPPSILATGICMNDLVHLGRAFNFAPTMPPLAPSVTPYSPRFVTSSRNSLHSRLRFCPTLCQGT